MAFQTEREDNRAAQQPGIRGAVRIVAHFAPFNAHRRMFKRKWPAFIGMTLEAGFFVAERLVHKRGTRCHSPRWSERPMRVVTIAACHEPFIDAMFERHGKFAPHVAMALVTKLRLAFRQQKFRALRFVNRVALCTSDAVQRVRRVANIGAGQSFGMASQASVQRLFRCGLRKSNDGRFSSMSFDMCASRPVAAFASCVRRLFRPARNALEMRIFVEPEPDIRMARLANHTAYVGVTRCLLRACRGVYGKYGRKCATDSPDHVNTGGVCLSFQWFQPENGMQDLTRSLRLIQRDVVIAV